MTEKQVPATIHTGVGTGLQLHTIEDIQRAAKLFIASGMFAEKNMEADMAKACVKLIAGQELGLSAFQSMRGIDIVQGQAVFRYQLVGAKIKQTGRYDFRPVEVSAKRAAIQFYDNGRPVFLSEFTMEDAKAQELAGKSNYKKIPKDMLFARALTNGANKVCPEIYFSPCYSPEDFGQASGEILPTAADIEEVEAIERLPIPDTKPWLPTVEDWENLKADAMLNGTDTREFDRFVNSQKGKGLGPAGIFNKTKEMYIKESIRHEPDTDDGREPSLDEQFADRCASDE